jgi:hypothetical protein
VASVLLSLAVGLSSSVGAAWITDLVPRAALDRGMSISSATGWVAGILGFLAGGQAIQHLGIKPAYGVGLALMGAAAVLVAAIRRPNQASGS